MKLIGVYSSEENAQSAIVRLSQQPGFVDQPDGFHIDRYGVDQDHWTEGFITAVTVEVPLKDSNNTVAAQATLLASGYYELWPEPEASTDEWVFKPNQTVRCELRRSTDGVELLVAVELVSG